MPCSLNSQLVHENCCKISSDPKNLLKYFPNTSWPNWKQSFLTTEKDANLTCDAIQIHCLMLKNRDFKFSKPDWVQLLGVQIFGDLSGGRGGFRNFGRAILHRSNA